MLFVRPDFYEDFACLASRCRHSCCIGWEIDIDEQTLSHWQYYGGAFWEKLRGSLSLTPTPHFVLDEKRRCPLLRSDGLCELILQAGEDSLCDICASHPRFYNESEGRIEAGLGLCCEEAARLLLERTGPLRLVAEDDGEPDFADETLFLVRDEVFTALAENGLSFAERAEKALRLLNTGLRSLSNAESADFLLTLERMDEDWTRLLHRLRELPPSAEEIPAEPYARLCAYFVYRHLLAGGEDALAPRLRFCVFACRLLHTLARLTPLAEALRLFSAEIEYSDENVEKLLAWL